MHGVFLSSKYTTNIFDNIIRYLLLYYKKIKYKKYPPKMKKTASWEGIFYLKITND